MLFLFIQISNLTLQRNFGIARVLLCPCHQTTYGPSSSGQLKECEKQKLARLQVGADKCIRQNSIWRVGQKLVDGADVVLPWKDLPPLDTLTFVLRARLISRTKRGHGTNFRIVLIHLETTRSTSQQMFCKRKHRWCQPWLLESQMDWWKTMPTCWPVPSVGHNMKSCKGHYCDKQHQH